MSYTLEDDEVGIILRPLYPKGKDTWEGDVSTNIVMAGKANKIESDVKYDLLNIITLMSTFLDYVHQNPDVLEDVENYRDYLFEQTFQEDLKQAYTTEEGSNVVKLNIFTKTRGNA